MLLNNIYRISEKTRKRWIGITKKIQHRRQHCSPLAFCQNENSVVFNVEFFCNAYPTFSCFFR